MQCAVCMRCACGVHAACTQSTCSVRAVRVVQPGGARGAQDGGGKAEGRWRRRHASATAGRGGVVVRGKGRDTGAGHGARPSLSRTSRYCRGGEGGLLLISLSLARPLALARTRTLASDAAVSSAGGCPSTRGSTGAWATASARCASMVKTPPTHPPPRRGPTPLPLSTQALVGALAFAVRGALNVDLFSTYMEAAVGISIMVIGLSGIAEAREWSREHDDGPTESNAHHDIEVILESDREQSVRLPPVYLYTLCLLWPR